MPGLPPPALEPAPEQLSWKIPAFGEGEQGNEHKSKFSATPGKGLRQRVLLPPGDPSWDPIKSQMDPAHIQ